MDGSYPRKIYKLKKQPDIVANVPPAALRQAYLPLDDTPVNMGNQQLKGRCKRKTGPEQEQNRIKDN